MSRLPPWLERGLGESHPERCGSKEEVVSTRAVAPGTGFDSDAEHWRPSARPAGLGSSAAKCNAPDTMFLRQRSVGRSRALR